jgi:hypothetical protein
MICVNNMTIFRYHSWVILLLYITHSCKCGWPSWWLSLKPKHVAVVFVTNTSCVRGILTGFRRVRKVVLSGYYFRHVCSPVRPSARNNSALIEQICMKFDIWVFFENLSREFKFHWILTRITATLHEDQCTFLSYFVHYLLERKILQINFVEKIKTRILFSVTFFFENHAAYEIMWKNIIQPDRSRVTI